MTPEAAIKADGIPLGAHIGDNLASLKLTDKDGMEADQLELAITDPTGSFALPRKGATLSLAMGWKGRGLVDKGTYVVDEVGEDGPPDTIVIIARSADFRDSLKQSREASYNSTTLGAVLTTIAERNKLIPAIHPDLASVVITHVSQTHETDANLVTRLAKDYGAVGTIKSGHLVFVPWGKGLTASGGLLPAVTITRKDGDTHSFRSIDRDGSQTGVQAKWVDLKSGATCFALAGAEGSVKTLKRTYPTQAEAKAAADAAWNRQMSKAHTFSHTMAVGDPTVCASAPLTLSGWRREIVSIAWLLGTITHDMGANGFTTSYEATEIIAVE